MRRASLSALHRLQHCTAALRPDFPIVKKKPDWKMKLGIATHLACEAYPNEPDWVSIAANRDVMAKADSKLIEHARDRYNMWLPFAQKHYDESWVQEKSFAYDPITASAREIPNCLPSSSEPGEWVVKVDVISPIRAWIADWKFGDWPVARPIENPQMWGTAPIVSLVYGWDECDVSIVQVNDKDGLTAPKDHFRAEHLGQSIERMRNIALRIVPDTQPNAGEEWCRFCPAKDGCPAYAELKMDLEANKTSTIVEEDVRQTTKPSTTKMSLANLRQGRQKTAIKAMVYGMPGVGKSTFLTSAPKPVVLELDNCTSHLDVARFPVATSYADVREAMTIVETEKHDFESLIVTPVNWVEKLLTTHILGDSGKNPKNWGGGFGAFWGAFDKEVLDFQTQLERIFQRGINVLMESHEDIDNFPNPEGDSWKYYRLAMTEHLADPLKQWVDYLMFARFERFSKEINGQVKGFSTDTRVLITQWQASCDAKGRDLPPILPLSWEAFRDAVAARDDGQRAADVSTAIRELAASLGDKEIVETAERYIEEARGNASQLMATLNRLQIKAKEMRAA